MVTRFRALRRPIAALLCLSLGACHTTRPMERIPSANDEARVRLTDLGAAMMAPIVGPGVTGLRGTITALDSTTIRMSVIAVLDRDGLENRWLGEQVTVKREHITGFDERELSGFKTALVVIGIGAGMFVLGRTISGGTDGLLQAIGFPKSR